MRWHWTLVVLAACHVDAKDHTDSDPLRGELLLPGTSGDDEAMCTSPGTLTFRNSVEPFLDRYCVKCHTTDAVSPQDAWGTFFDEVDWHDESQGPAVAYSIYYALGAEGVYAMPPSSEESPTEDEVTAVQRWYEDTYDSGDGDWTTALGTEPATVELTEVSLRLRQLDVSFEAIDLDSEATVTLFLDSDDEGWDGEAILGCLEESPTLLDILGNPRVLAPTGCGIVEYDPTSEPILPKKVQRCSERR